MSRKLLNITVLIISLISVSSIYYLNIFSKDIINFFKINSIFSFIFLSILFPLVLFGFREIIIVEKFSKEEEDFSEKIKRINISFSFFVLFLFDLAYLSLR